MLGQLLDWELSVGRGPTAGLLLSADAVVFDPYGPGFVDTRSGTTTLRHTEMSVEFSRIEQMTPAHRESRIRRASTILVGWRA